MLHDLYDTDLDLARSISALSTTTAGDQSRRYERGRYTAFHPVFHLMLPSFIYTILYGVQGSGLAPRTCCPLIVNEALLE